MAGAAPVTQQPNRLRQSAQRARSGVAKVTAIVTSLASAACDWQAPALSTNVNHPIRSSFSLRATLAPSSESGSGSGRAKGTQTYVVGEAQRDTHSRNNISLSTCGNRSP